MNCAPFRGDGASVPVPNHVDDLYALVVVVRRLRIAQRALAARPSAGGRAMVRGLEQLVDHRIAQFPTTDVGDTIDQALLQSIDILGDLQDLREGGDS